jgi:hypothetical protein
MAIAASVALLTSCSAAPVPALSPSNLASIRASILDSQWSIVSGEYPEAVRPDIRVKRTVSDHDWPLIMVACLNGAGFKAFAESGGVSYASSQGQTPIEYAVSYYDCAAQYPALSDIVSRLDPRLAELQYEYQVNVVRPCLLLSGAPSPPSPDRSAAQGLEGLAGWNPYQLIWLNGMSLGTVRYLEHTCPPIPPWLDLAQRTAR